MSSIGTSIELYDKVSATLNRIQSNLESTTRAFQNIDNASNKCFSKTQIQAISSEILTYEQHIERVENQLRKANHQINQMKVGTEQVKNEANNLGSSFGSVFSMFGAYMGFQGLQQLVSLSDAMGQADAKLGLITEDSREQAEMQDRIFEAAQRSRGSYMAMADNVAKLGQRAGDAFNSNDEILQFSENLTKMFVIAGASTAEMNSASLQLTQALGSGVLRGEELNAVFESAPNVIQTIADYMDVPKGKIREMASEGQITSEIVKNAMLSATTDINKQFESMPMTWGQIWTMTTNELLRLSQPLLNFISMLAQHWNTLKPIAIALALSVVVYAGSLVTAKVATLATAAATNISTIAQMGFNAALSACPITWIIIGIIAIITVIYMLAQAYADTTDATETAFGIITGCVASGIAFIWNIIVACVNGFLQLLYSMVDPILSVVEWILNVLNGGFDSFGAGVANLIGRIISWFLNLGIVVTKIIDAIFGTDWTAGLNEVKDALSTFGENKNAVKLDRTFTGIQRVEYGNAYNAGVKWGDSVTDKVNTVFGNKPSTPKNLGTKEATKVNEVANNTANTAAGVNALKDSVDISNEQLQHMRDIAEQEVINRYTTAEIKVDMTNNNNISKDIDIDDFISRVADGVNEAMKISAEGVH